MYGNLDEVSSELYKMVALAELAEAAWQSSCRFLPKLAQSECVPCRFPLMAFFRLGYHGAFDFDFFSQT